MPRQKAGCSASSMISSLASDPGHGVLQVAARPPGLAVDSDLWCGTGKRIELLARAASSLRTPGLVAQMTGEGGLGQVGRAPGRSPQPRSDRRAASTALLSRRIGFHLDKKAVSWDVDTGGCWRGQASVQVGGCNPGLARPGAGAAGAVGRGVRWSSGFGLRFGWSGARTGGVAGRAPAAGTLAGSGDRIRGRLRTHHLHRLSAPHTRLVRGWVRVG